MSEKQKDLWANIAAAEYNSDALNSPEWRLFKLLFSEQWRAAYPQTAIDTTKAPAL